MRTFLPFALISPAAAFGPLLPFPDVPVAAMQLRQTGHSLEVDNQGTREFSLCETKRNLDSAGIQSIAGPDLLTKRVARMLLSRRFSGRTLVAF